MKAERISLDSFKPISINITIESEDEAKRFYALFNHFAIPGAFGIDNNEACNIIEAIGDQYSDQNIYDKCVKNLKARVK